MGRLYYRKSEEIVRVNNADNLLRIHLYTADGTKLSRTTQIASAPRMDYVSNLVYQDSTLSRILVEGGHIDMTGTTPAYRFYVTDYQGNIRLLTDASGTALQVNHYDPFGNELDMNAPSSPIGDAPILSGSDTVNPYKYSGKEWDSQASLYDFSARMFNPTLHRFTTMDPLSEKYYSISPYAYCAGNPVNLVDPSGETNWRAIKKGVLAMTAGAGSVAGGVVISGGTGGLAGPLGAMFIIDGVSGIGLGLGQVLIGLVSDSSDETTKAVESIPSDVTDTFLKSADIFFENENGEIEKIGGGLRILFSAGATQTVTGTAGALSRIGTGAQLLDYMMKGSSSNQEIEENTYTEEDKKRLNSEARRESRVDW